MTLLVLTDLRFVSDHVGGDVYTRSAGAYSFWIRYLNVFGRLKVLARVNHEPDAAKCAKRANGPGVEFVAVPYYHGPKDYLRCWSDFRRIVKTAIEGPEAVLLRVPSQIGNVATKILTRINKPFGAEIVGDPLESFSPGASDHQLRALLRMWFARSLRQQCRAAHATAYVTRDILQKKYPPVPNRFTTSYSSVELCSEAFVSRPRSVGQIHARKIILTIASLEQPYKGVDILLKAVRNCLSRGVDLSLVIVGEGRLRPQLEDLAQNLSLSDRVTFTGPIPSGDAIQACLDSADLFVLASRSEGLPRVLIEAMARGLPCLGTRVGGIPELLDGNALVEPSPSALAARIEYFLDNPGLTAAASARNLAAVQEYRDNILRPRRDAFYRALALGTADYLRRKGSWSGNE